MHADLLHEGERGARVPSRFTIARASRSIARPRGRRRPATRCSPAPTRY